MEVGSLGHFSSASISILYMQFSAILNATLYVICCSLFQKRLSLATKFFFNCHNQYESHYVKLLVLSLTSLKFYFVYLYLIIFLGFGGSYMYMLANMICVRAPFTHITITTASYVFPKKECTHTWTNSYNCCIQCLYYTLQYTEELHNYKVSSVFIHYSIFIAEHITEVHVVSQWFKKIGDGVYKLVKWWSVIWIHLPTWKHHTVSAKHECIMIDTRCMCTACTGLTSCRHDTINLNQSQTFMHLTWWL